MPSVERPEAKPAYQAKSTTGNTGERTNPAWSASEMMIVAAARELAGQRVCFVGVGLPNIAVNLARRTVAPDLELVYEAGVFGAQPARLPLSIGDPTIVTRATAVTSMFELFGYYLQGGLIDVGFLGAAQIDRHGNINTTVIGDYAQPKTRLPGSGGACEIALNAKQVFVIMRQSQALVRRPARLRTSVGDRVSVVVTDLGIYHLADGELRLDHLHPGVSARAGARRDGLGAARVRPTDRNARAVGRRAPTDPRRARSSRRLHEVAESLPQSAFGRCLRYARSRRQLKSTTKPSTMITTGTSAPPISGSTTSVASCGMPMTPKMAAAHSGHIQRRLPSRATTQITRKRNGQGGRGETRYVLVRGLDKGQVLDELTQSQGEEHEARHHGEPRSAGQPGAKERDAQGKQDQRPGTDLRKDELNQQPGANDHQQHAEHREAAALPVPRAGQELVGGPQATGGRFAGNGWLRWLALRERLVGRDVARFAGHGAEVTTF